MLALTFVAFLINRIGHLCLQRFFQITFYRKLKILGKTIRKQLYKASFEQATLNKLDYKTEQAFGGIFSSSSYELMATFTFTDGNRISKDIAHWQMSLFLNELDKVYFGNNAARKDIRVEREVFLHTTHEGGRFIHYHIYFNSLGYMPIFVATLKRLWKLKIYNAGSVDVALNHSGFYGMRETRQELGYDSWITELCHKDSGSDQYTSERQAHSQQTLNRLRKIHGHWENNTITLKEHLQNTRTKTLRQTRTI